MIVSPYATKLTRMIQSGEKNPERDMSNRKSSEAPRRKALWQSRQAKQAA